MPLSIGTPLTSTVIWRPSQPPHPPDRPPLEWAALPQTAPVQVLRYLGRPQGEWPPALVVTEAAEGPLPLRQGPPAVDAARLPREESTPPSGRSGTPPVPVGASTPRGRPRQGQKEPRGRGRRRGRGGRPPRPNPSPTLPWTPPGGSTQGSPQAPLNQADLQRRLRMLLQDQQQIAAGLLQHANADQVNAVSELVLNLLKQNIPITPATMNQLRPHKNVLRNLARRKHSLKKRRQWLVAQKIVACGKVSTLRCVNVFDGETFDVGRSPARRQPSTRSLERGLSVLAA